MKTIISVVLACLFYQVSHAQFLGGFFSQKKTQREYLMQQIAALKVYKGYVEKGYAIAKGGLNLISAIKNGDLNLHHIFFNSLKRVSPTVRKYSGIADLMELNVQTIKIAMKLTRYQTNLFDTADNQFIRQVGNNVLAELGNTLQELVTVVTDNQLQLSDDERIHRMDRLLSQTRDQNKFTRSFVEELTILENSKNQQRSEIETSRILYNLNN